MNYRNTDSLRRVDPAQEMDGLDGYLRPARPQAPSGNDSFVIVLDEVRPALHSVRQVMIRRQHIRTQVAPVQAGGLSGYHFRPLGQVATRPAVATAPPALRELQSGRAYRVTSSRERNMVTPELAQALEKAFETFAARCGFTDANPVSIELSRGYEAGDRGHGRGMAADIQSVGGQSLAYWAQEFAKTVAQAKFINDESQRHSLMAQQASSNLGYLLYRTLLEQGGWRIFNRVVQLFGPWTPRLGPWKRLQVPYPDEAQKQIMVEQDRIYRAHRDHIHVAFG